MIQLLTAVVVMECMIAMLLTTDVPPIRKLMRRIDYAKSSRLSAVIKTVAGSVFVVLQVQCLVSSVSSIMTIQGHSRVVGAITLSDQTLLKTHKLEASLMGISIIMHSFLFNFQLSSEQVVLECTKRVSISTVSYESFWFYIFLDQSFWFY
ncbi:hypothetical protein SUGI_0258590 [Cryptomeria japonica]|nr:hypothetical protein SUGI_0258590 [Cryptomeria japonica]